MLARIRKAMDENEQGFTLIELLVVMIIIGILAAIAIPVFLNQRKNAVDASYKSDLRTVANEMESYFTDNEVYPTTAPSNASAGAAVTGIGGRSGVRVSKNTKIAVTYNVTGPTGRLLHPGVQRVRQGFARLDLRQHRRVASSRRPAPPARPARSDPDRAHQRPDRPAPPEGPGPRGPGPSAFRTVLAATAQAASAWCRCTVLSSSSTGQTRHSRREAGSQSQGTA